MLLAGGCGGRGESAEPGSPEGAITGFSAEAARVDASFEAIHEHLQSRSTELREAALEHLEDDDRNVRYASLYALALTAEKGESVEALRSFLKSNDVSERMLAAGSLVARGEKAAIPVLIDALGSDGLLDFRDPPKPAWEFAHLVLTRYTGRESPLHTPPDLAAAVAAKTAWESWWREQGESLRWNPAMRVYEE